MRVITNAGLLLFVSVAALAQDGLLTENPLEELKAEVERVLDEAGLPFSEGEDRQIVLIMDERRRASEELFGDLQDFTAGPTQGQQADELLSAINWMQGEFLTLIGNFLTEE